MSGPNIQILIVDDHSLVRKGLEYTVKAEFGKSHVQSVSDAESALAKCAENRYDVVITDINLPKTNGLELTRRIAEKYPETKIIVLSMYLDVAHVQEAIDSGANGYISKVDDEGEIIVAIKEIMEGKSYYGTKTSQILVDGYFQEKNRRLSSKEIEVTKYIANGLVYKEIADKMDISVRTVETYRKNILEKLDVTTNADIIKYALKKGLVD